MPYPETTTGFTITDPKNWTTFSKQEVSFGALTILLNSTDACTAQTQAFRRQ
jgi:hypothetical protein